MIQTADANRSSRKSRWKNGVICLPSMFPSWVIVLKLSEKVHFLQFTYMHLKSLVTHFKKMLFIMLWLTMSEILGFEVLNSVKFLLTQYLFWYFIANVSWLLAQTPINYIIFWKSIMGTFSCIYVNGFNRLRFLAEVSTKFKKMHFFFWTI